MTVREFYDWAKRHDCLDYEVEIQHRDDLLLVLQDDGLDDYERK